jgi:FKBP-type peptidyl-prolyl cis-trans isomerase 2
VAIAYIDSVEGDQVVVNLNTPLAGETLYFAVKIAGLRPVTPEDLAESCGGCAGCGSGACGCGDDDCDCEDDECGCGCGH